MSKFKLLIFCLILSSIVSAQTFELVGPRNYNPSNWDVPTSVNLYFDSSGTLYNYINEASQPRSNELVRYNAATNNWTNLTNDSFSVPNGSGNTGGIPMADGSIVTITNSFGGPNAQHYAYTIFPNGTATPFPTHPFPVANNAGISIFPVQAPNGDIYYSHNVINVDVGKWDGTQWTELPEVTTGTFGGSSGIGVDENGDVYVVHTDNTTGYRARLVKFDQVNSTWNQVFLSPETGLEESEIYVVSSSEIYIYYSSNTQLYVTRFNGTGIIPITTTMGNPVPGQGTFLRPGAMLKSSVGDVYLANYTNSGNGFYKYNTGADNWDIVPNDIADGGLIVGYHPTLTEKDGCIYVSGNENNGITTVKYCPSCATVNLDIFYDAFPAQTSWDIQDDNGNTVASGNGNGLPNNAWEVETACLPDGCYTLNFYDALNNGMCPFQSNAVGVSTFVTPGTLITPGTIVGTLFLLITPGLCGNYDLTDAAGNTIVSGGGLFGASETNTFCIVNGVLQRIKNDRNRLASQPLNKTLLLYPNPATEILNIQFNQNAASETQLNVLDAAGKIVLSKMDFAADSNIQLNIRDLNPGIYFVQITNNEETITERFMVK